MSEMKFQNRPFGFIVKGAILEFRGAILQSRGAILPGGYFALQNLTVQTVHKKCIKSFLDSMLYILGMDDNIYPSYSSWKAERPITLCNEGSFS